MAQPFMILMSSFFLFCFGGSCGDGIFDPETEECDGVDHCTLDCLCEDNYIGEDGKNECIPVCPINGCDGKCASPNECVLCSAEGYKKECSMCEDGYFSNGYLNCKPLEGNTHYSCSEKAKENNITVNDDFNEHIEFIDTREWYLTSTYCSPIAIIGSPYMYGKWFQLNMGFNGYIVIETVEHYNRYNITYYRLNQIETGIDTVLSLQIDCPENNLNEIRCACSNDDVDDYILSSRIISPVFQSSTYYLLVHSPTDPLNASFNLYIKRIRHPCSYAYEEIPWNSIISDGFHYVLNSNHGVFSNSACSKVPLNGFWFHLHGLDRPIIMSTCGTVGDYSTSIHVVSVPFGQEENADCSYIEGITECETYSHQGCTEVVNGSTIVKSKARLLITLSLKKDYFVFVSYQTSRYAMIDFFVTIACPYNCNGHGKCTENGCLCDDGYNNVGDSCSACGNGKLDEGEECDLSIPNSTDKGCDATTCMCHYGNTQVTINGTTKCAPMSCGNGIIDVYEECDGGEGCYFCRCNENYVPHFVPQLGCLSGNCGNKRLDDNEECDGGEGCYECKCEKGWHSVEKLSCSRIPYWSMYILVFIPGFPIYWVVWAIIMIYFVRAYYVLTKKIEMEQTNLEHVIPFLEKSMIKFDKTNSRFINISEENPFFSFLSPNIEFGKELPLDYPQTTTISLKNKRKETLRFTFHACETMRYDLMFKPVTGTIKSNETMIITAIITVKCTTVLTEKIPVTITFPRLKDSVALKYSTEQISQNSSSDESQKKKKPGIKKFHVYLNLNVESELSTRIDFNSLNIIYPPIGKGTFGSVYKATWRNADVAVKIIKTDYASIDELKTNFAKEMKIMEQTQNSHIVQFIGSAETENSLCLIMEYFPLGSLRKFYMENEMVELLKVRMCENIANALDYLHNKQIIHYDLKPDNILVASSNPNELIVCKVGDFGTALTCNSLNSQIEKNIGTPMYMAPEVHKTGVSSFKSDVFSYAICILEIWLCKCVYPQQEFPQPSDVLEFICSGQRPTIPDSCSYKSIIESCWLDNPIERPNFKKIQREIQQVLKSYERVKSNGLIPLDETFQHQNRSKKCFTFSGKKSMKSNLNDENQHKSTRSDVHSNQKCISLNVSPSLLASNNTPILPSEQQLLNNASPLSNQNFASANVLEETCETNAK